MIELYFVYNGHCKFFLGSFNNVDELIEQMKEHQWAFSGITRPRFKKYIGKDDVRFDYGAVDCYYLATKSTCREPRKKRARICVRLGRMTYKEFASSCVFEP